MNYGAFCLRNRGVMGWEAGTFSSRVLSGEIVVFFQKNALMDYVKKMQYRYRVRVLFIIIFFSFWFLYSRASDQQCLLYIQKCNMYVCMYVRRQLRPTTALSDNTLQVPPAAATTCVLCRRVYTMGVEVYSLCLRFEVHQNTESSYHQSHILAVQFYIIIINSGVY